MGEHPARGAQPDHDDDKADDSTDDLDVGPNLRSLRWDAEVQDIVRESREMERSPGAWRKPTPTQVEHFDREGYFVDGMGPRVFTIAQARAGATGDAIQYLPVLGVDGFIVRGWSHLLAGWWRLGKSELMAATILPWLRLGEKVLWITEEPDSIWVDRAAMFDEIYDPVPWEHLTLMDALSAPPNELLEKASNLAEDVVIVDTIREVCGNESMKDDDAVHRAMGPWLRRLRDDHITSVYVAQHRKAAGEQGERVMGSVTLPAKFDIVLELERVEGHERQRRLTARRRRRATAPLTYEMDDDDRIVVVPDGRSRGRVEVEAAVVSQVTASAEPLTTAEVRRRMTPQPSLDSVLRALTAGAKDGRILRDPPIADDAWRRTVRWLRTRQVVTTVTTSTAGKLPQDLHTRLGEISAVDDVAVDLAANTPSTTHTGVPVVAATPITLSQDTGLPFGWLEEDDKRRRALLDAGKSHRAAFARSRSAR
jgi:AAA domain